MGIVPMKGVQMKKRKYEGTDAERRKKAQEVWKAKFPTEEAYKEYCQARNKRYEIRQRAKRFLKGEKLTLDEHIDLLCAIQTAT